MIQNQQMRYTPGRKADIAKYLRLSFIEILNGILLSSFVTLFVIRVEINGRNMNTTDVIPTIESASPAFNSTIGIDTITDRNSVTKSKR